MQKIWKYPFSIHSEFSIELPEDAQILDVQGQMQFDQAGNPTQELPIMWAKGNPEHPTETRTFKIFATDEDIDSIRLASTHHVKTFQMDGGRHVWHLFEKRR